MRLLERISEWLDDVRETKAISMLGDAALGPPCRICGRPDFALAPPNARRVLNRMCERRHGFSMDEAPGVCQCRKAVAA